MTVAPAACHQIDAGGVTVVAQSRLASFMLDTVPLTEPTRAGGWVAPHEIDVRAIGEYSGRRGRGDHENRVRTSPIGGHSAFEGQPGARVEPDDWFHAARKHLPVVSLRRAA